MRPSLEKRLLVVLLSLIILPSMTLPAGGADGDGVIQEPSPQFRASSANLGAVPGSAPMDNSTLWTV